MATRKALIFVNGELQQLPQGDTLDVTSGGIRLDIGRTNTNAGLIVIGQVVYPTSDTEVDLARANVAGTSDAIGLVASTSIAASAVGNIVVKGILEATTGEWDAVTGDVGGLTFNTEYFVDNTTPGKITSTPPGSGFIVRLGHAISTTKFRVLTQPPEAI